MSNYKKHLNELYGLLKGEVEQKQEYDKYIKEHGNNSKLDFISNIFLKDRYIENMKINVFPHFRFSPPMYHTQSYLMITCVLKGEFVNTVEGEQLLMHDGDVCICAPFTYRSFDCTSQNFEERCNSTALSIFVNPLYIEELFETQLKENNQFANFMHNISIESQHSKYALFTCNDNCVSKRLAELLWFEMRDSRDENDVANSDIGVSIFKAFLSEITSPKRYNISFSNAMSRACTNDIITYISNHFKTMTLQKLADHFNYSIPHLSKLIKQRIGKTFSEFIAELKLERAKFLLETSSITVNNIANECGYNSIEHFLRTFKNHYGITPTEYRKSHKNT